MKSAAYERIMDIVSEHDELAFTVGLALLPLIFVDFALIPLSVLGIEGGLDTLGYLGMEDVNVDRNGDSFTITYNDSDGEPITQTCDYDAATDSIRTVISQPGGGGDALIFEYVGADGAYASQYLFDSDDEFSLIRVFFDGDIMAIGIDTVESMPDSIFKKTGLQADFVKNDATYFILEGGTLTVFADGEVVEY